MRFGDNTYHQLLLSVDALNTIHGGVSEPYFLMNKGKEGYRIHVRIPGVEAEKVKIEVENNNLTIFYFHVFEHGTGQAVTRLPYIIRQINIPFDVDIKAIEASHEGHNYYVDMPYNDLSGGYRKEIGFDK